MKKGLFVFLAIALMGLFPAFALAEAASTPSDRPIPRFVSLRADEVNLRAGPGVRYPVEWIYKRRNLPTDIIAEFGTWRKIRDWEGTQGWVHQSMLSARRGIIVTGDVRTLRDEPNARSRPIARAEEGVIGNLIECPAGSTWCRVDVSGHRGWLRKAEFWGAYNAEIVD